MDLRVSSEHQSECGVSMASRVMAQSSRLQRQESRVGVRKDANPKWGRQAKELCDREAPDDRRVTDTNFFCVCVPHLILYTGDPC